jgi:hypothetical protein
MKMRYLLSGLVFLAMLTVFYQPSSLAQTSKSKCPTLEQASLSSRQDRQVRSIINRKFKAKGETGAYNLVVIGRYGLATWFNKSEGTGTPIAVLINGNQVQAYILNPYSIDRLLALGYPLQTAKCLEQLSNEAGI